jgi:hypothetical protein
MCVQADMARGQICARQCKQCARMALHDVVVQAKAVKKRVHAAERRAGAKIVHRHNQAGLVAPAWAPHYHSDVQPGLVPPTAACELLPFGPHISASCYTPLPISMVS